MWHPSATGIVLPESIAVTPFVQAAGDTTGRFFVSFTSPRAGIFFGTITPEGGFTGTMNDNPIGTLPPLSFNGIHDFAGVCTGNLCTGASGGIGARFFDAKLTR